MKKITLFMMALVMTFGAMAQFSIGNRIMQNNDAHTAFKYNGKITEPAFVNNTKTASVIISAVATETNNVTFTATPNADCASYKILVASTGAVESYATQNSTTVEAVIATNGDEYSGVQDLAYTGLEANTAYTIYVLATANDQTTVVSTTNFTSAVTGGTGTANVVFTVDNVTTYSADLSFTINDQTSYYYYLVESVDTLALYGYTTTDDIRTLLETYGTKSYTDLAGAYGDTDSPLTNNTEFIVCAFAYNQNDVLGTFTAPIHFITGQGVITGLNDVDAISSSVYPNPAKDNVNIAAKSKIERVEMFNMMGQKVSEKSVNSMFTSVNVANLNAGTYVVKVYTAAGVATKKIVVR